MLFPAGSIGGHKNRAEEIKEGQEQLVSVRKGKITLPDVDCRAVDNEVVFLFMVFYVFTYELRGTKNIIINKNDHLALGFPDPPVPGYRLSLPFLMPQAYQFTAGFLCPYHLVGTIG